MSSINGESQHSALVSDVALSHLLVKSGCCAAGDECRGFTICVARFRAQFVAARRSTGSRARFLRAGTVHIRSNTAVALSRWIHWFIRHTDHARSGSFVRPGPPGNKAQALKDKKAAKSSKSAPAAKARKADVPSSPISSPMNQVPLLLLLTLLFEPFCAVVLAVHAVNAVQWNPLNHMLVCDDSKEAEKNSYATYARGASLCPPSYNF